MITKKNTIVLVAIAIGLILTAFYFGTVFAPTTQNNVDSEYKRKIDSLQKQVELYRSLNEILDSKYDSLSDLNNTLKNEYDKEKNNNNSFILQLPIDNTIKYWTIEFTKIGIY